MFVTKNRAGVVWVLFLAVLVGLTACTPPGPRALLEGRKLLEAGQTDAALAKLKIAASLLPTNAAAWNYLGLACHRAGQWTNAAEAYSRAIRLDRELLEARFNLGCLWLDQNQLDAAKAEFTAYTLRRGNSVDGWLKLGATQLRGRELAAAEKSYREALRVEAKNAEAFNGLGLVLLQRNRPREAADSFGEALKAQPDYRPALLNLATVSQQQLNDRAEALRRYREYLALQPRAADWEAVNAIVQSLEQPAAAPAQPRPQPVATVTNPPKPAVAVVTRPTPAPKPEPTVTVAKPAPTPKPASTVAPPPPQPEMVRLTPDPIIQSTPNDATSVVAKESVPVRETTVSTIPPATAKSERGFLSKLNPFRSEAKPPPTDEPRVAKPPVAPGRYAYLAPALPRPGNRRAAESAFAQGQQSQRADRQAEALQSFRRAAQLDPAYFEAYYSVGLTAFNQRSFQVALTAWEFAMAIRPDNPDVRYNFALTLKAAGYHQDAADELEKLLSLHPDEARGHLTLGNLYADELRDVPRARRHYYKVLQLDPRNPQAQAIRYWLVANPG